MVNSSVVFPVTSCALEEVSLYSAEMSEVTVVASFISDNCRYTQGNTMVVNVDTGNLITQKYTECA